MKSWTPAFSVFNVFHQLGFPHCYSHLVAMPHIHPEIQYMRGETITKNQVNAPWTEADYRHAEEHSE